MVCDLARRSRLASRLLSLSVFAMCGVVGCTPEGAPAPGTSGGAKRFNLLPRQEPRPPSPQSVWPPQAIWVVRQRYGSPTEIAALMENVRQAGLNTVLLQVRGTGTAYYRSHIEPMAYEYRGDPGFDPLEVACREAHRRGLALHAWVNVMPAWHGQAPPSDPRQLYNAHPDWFWYDQHGRRQPLGWYVSLNPCLPQVREYLVDVCREIVQRYPVDGLHLDYIRFPNDQSPRGVDYPYDKQTLAMYKRETGKRPQDDRARWSAWRTYQVSQLVYEIRTMLLKTRAGVRLTAACGQDFAEWRRDRFQDGPGWLRGKLVDLVFVMNYSSDTSVFRQRQEAWQRAAGGYPTAPGIGMYLHGNDRTTIDQLRLAQRWNQGFGLFSASVLFSADPRSRQRLATLRPILLSLQGGRTADAADFIPAAESPFHLADASAN